METPRAPKPLPPPPGVINAIKAGMDVISSHLSLLFLPLALDAFLWFGPRLSVEDLFSDSFGQMLALAGKSLPTEEVNAVQQLMAEWLPSFNLLSVLRTFPIGISSLMSGKLPVENPLGTQSLVRVSSDVSLVGWFFLLTFIGWILGGLYFNWVSGVTGARSKSSGPVRAVVQTLLFSMIITTLLFLVGIPAIFMLGILGLINSAILQVAMFVLALFSAWIVVPIFFAPHGMYLRGQNAFYSIYASLRMARFTLPTSSMFVLAVFVISQGLNFLWAVPEDNSWMTAVGIAGHAFVTTALLAASFIYYRDMNAWLEIVFERLKPDAAARQT
jgi:hypothetical protein